MAWAEAASLCGTEETAFFACQTSRGRHIALCGRLPEEELQYRFGLEHHVELQFPEDKKLGMGEFLFAHYFRYQTNRFEIRFTNRGTDYTVFDYDEEEGERLAGVRVVTPDGRVRDLECAGPLTSRLGELKEVLRCDPDNALNLMRNCP